MNRWIWDAIPIPDTIIAQLNALDQGQPNDLQLRDSKKRPIKEIDIKGMDDGGNEALRIELVEPDTDINPKFTRVEPIPDLVELQDTSTIEEETQQ